ncbi:MAG: type II secretion system F family protein, partial [Candidatus Eisenbacteria bacterium]|nr:type II secretion system F family protein [Candidatus Eisenbacteria bacterium]
HERIFSLLFISMVRSGEESGALPQVLARLASYLEARDALTRKIKSAATYPAFIAVFFVGAIVAVMFFLIPRFEDIFADFDMALPPMTQILISTSRFLGDNIVWELLFIGGGAYLLHRWWKTASGKKRIDQIMLKTPLFGKLIQKASVARFSRTLGTLLSNGVTVVAALEIVSETAGNTIVKEAIDGVGLGVVNGATISEKLSESPVFPKMVVSMVAAGESSGNLPEMLEKIADFYTDEVDAAISGLTSLIEPALIVGLGGVVAVVVLAIYLPIFSMATGIQ